MNPTPQNERASFTRVLQSLGLLDEFLALCRGGATTSQLRAWAGRQPKLAGVYVPACFKIIRKNLGVSGKRGGKRVGHGRCVHFVKGATS